MHRHHDARHTAGGDFRPALKTYRRAGAWQSSADQVKTSAGLVGLSGTGRSAFRGEGRASPEEIPNVLSIAAILIGGLGVALASATLRRKV